MAQLRQRAEALGEARRAWLAVRDDINKLQDAGDDASARQLVLSTFVPAAEKYLAVGTALVDATVRHSAEAAGQTSALAASAAQAAQKGGAEVGQVVTNMGEIQASSRKIADIIGSIDGMAFQTNILALYAAVEAARAGEQRRSADAARENSLATGQQSAGIGEVTDIPQKVIRAKHAGVSDKTNHNTSSWAASCAGV